jgi:hypothetical protein
MLRCTRCGGRATATLAHLHCLNEHLCVDCTMKVVEAREAREARQTSQRTKKDDFGDYEYPREQISRAA